MKKKAFVAMGLAVCLVAALGMTACSSTQNEVVTSEPETPAVTSTPEEAEEPIATETPETSEGEETEDVEEMPASETYFGTVASIEKDEEGNVISISLTSEENGDYVMNVTDNTVWVDAVEKAKASQEDLTEGETIYVYHSPVSTRSLPPQSEAFAIVLNVPKDIAVGVYHEVEEVTTTKNDTRLLTNNGGLYLIISDETAVKDYETSEVADISAVAEGDHVIAWYDAVAMSYPGQANVSDILVLPAVETVETDTDTADVDAASADDTAPAEDTELEADSEVAVEDEAASSEVTKADK